MDEPSTTPPQEPQQPEPSADVPPPLPVTGLPESQVVWVTNAPLPMDAVPLEDHAAQPLLSSSPPADPWAHRRGEPRVFAFLWTIYVLLAVAGSILWVARFADVSPNSFSPAARIMLVVIAIGATVLWPMVRLSQASPRGRAVSHIFADTLVVLLPIQLVVWPLIVLAAWPFTIVLAVAATLAAWVALCGGLLAIALSGRPATRPGDAALGARSFWMIVILLVVGAAPLTTFGFQAARTPMPAWLAMLSPLTAIPTISGTGMTGPQSPVTPLEMQIVAFTAIIAAGLWLVAGVRSMLGKHPEPA